MMRTNGSDVKSWADMPSKDSPTSTSGIAIEYMAQLANEVGAIPWFTRPHQADDDYVCRFATYVRDNLDPALSVRAESSNEAWNFSLSQASWLRDQSIAEWGEERHIDFHAKRATEVARIWEDVFAGKPEG